VELGQRGIHKIINVQNSDGSWFYGNEGRVTKYIDNFHTGFILKALNGIPSKYKTKILEEAFESGLEFYEKSLFTRGKNGLRPLHFFPKYVPLNSNIVQRVDIRDCAMGIIIFSGLGKNDEAYR